MCEIIQNKTFKIVLVIVLVPEIRIKGYGFRRRFFEYSGALNFYLRKGFEIEIISAGRFSEYLIRILLASVPAFYSAGYRRISVWHNRPSRTRLKLIEKGKGALEAHLLMKYIKALENVNDRFIRIKITGRYLIVNIKSILRSLLEQSGDELFGFATHNYHQFGLDTACFRMPSSSVVFEIVLEELDDSKGADFYIENRLPKHLSSSAILSTNSPIILLGDLRTRYGLMNFISSTINCFFRRFRCYH